MNRLFFSLAVALVLAAATWAQPTQPESDEPAEEEARPATVAILDYDMQLPNQDDLGSQIADILTARLSVVDAVRLVERDELGKILDEQQLKLIGLVDKKDAAKVGKLTGAQLMIMGRGFVMDKKLYIVTKIVGVETGLVSGTYRTVELSKPMSDAVMLLAEDLVKAIADDAAKLLPEEVQLADPLADIRTANRKKHEANQPVPTVAVVIPEEHRSERPAPAVLDPAGETEIKKLLIDAGFKVQDVGRNDLADWAKNVGKNKPWPAALDDVDVVVIGEGFSEFAARTGELVTSTGRLEINLIDRHSGEVILSDRSTQRAVDLGEYIAGKTALQKAGHELGLRIANRLAEYELPPDSEPQKSEQENKSSNIRQGKE